MTSIYDVLKASKGIHVDDTFAELWGRKLSNAYSVATYTGTLPATLTGTKAGYLESYKIYGNTVQAGTPTPETPIMPSGCGERTENLFDISTWYGVKVRKGNIEEVNNGFKITALFNDAYTITYGLTQYSYKVIPNEKYTLSWTVDNPKIDGYVYVFSGSTMGNNIIASVVASQQKLSFTVPSEHSYIAFRLGVSSSGNSITYTDIMLNLGSTALPYEPYGYKLPILSNSTVTSIYLGEVETTRRIRKIEFTGNETWTQGKYPPDNHCYQFYTEKPSKMIGSEFFMVSHFINKEVANGCRIGDFFSIFPKFSLLPENAKVNDFKAYLAAQYSAGTPVTVWYVLAELETGIVNKPLMKIGNYVDTIDSTQTSVQIPTAAGETTISWAGEGLAPSEVELTYRKPKGQ